MKILKYFGNLKLIPDELFTVILNKQIPLENISVFPMIHSIRLTIDLLFMLKFIFPAQKQIYGRQGEGAEGKERIHFMPGSF